MGFSKGYSYHGKPREGCVLCGEVTSSVDLLPYEGICWYCYLDTATSEVAKSLRAKVEKVVYVGASPQHRHEKIVHELLRRRAKRETLWSVPQ